MTASSQQPSRSMYEYEIIRDVHFHEEQNMVRDAVVWRALRSERSAVAGGAGEGSAAPASSINASTTLHCCC